jgi:hypothetical protein
MQKTSGRILAMVAVLSACIALVPAAGSRAGRVGPPVRDQLLTVAITVGGDAGIQHQWLTIIGTG